MTITAGWWLVPTALTVIAYVWSGSKMTGDSGHYGMGAVADAFVLMMVTIPVLLVWVIYFAALALFG